MIGFIFFFFLSPGLYAYVSISNDDKRTDYMGKEIAVKTQYAWDQQFDSKINVVLGDEWNAGNLSYHLKSRPVWEGPPKLVATLDDKINFQHSIHLPKLHLFWSRIADPKHIEFSLQFLYPYNQFFYHHLKLKHKRKVLVIKRKRK